VTVTRAPGSAAATAAEPPWARAIATMIASPRPAPARAKHSNARPANSLGKPGPWSRTAIRTSPSPPPAPEQRELRRSQLDLQVTARAAPRRRVEPQARGPQHRLALAGPRRTSRAQPRQQLLERERLDHVVVGAAVQPGDAVGDPSRAVSISTGAQTPAARSRRQVSKPSIPGASCRARSPSWSVAPAIQSASSPRVDVGAQPALAHAAPDDAGQLDLVLDDQHAHVRERRTRRMSAG
jgi:hypothetical protein